MTIEIHRRALLQGAAASAAWAIGEKALAAAPAPARWPKGFLWGAGTAAHQVEGNNVNNDGWLIEGLPESGFAEVSGDACDHYHRFAEDIRLLAGLGLNTYRFSVEWARIEPREGQFSRAELDHYRAVLAACRAAGLKTVVTLFHFTAPLWVAKKGGFTNPDVVPLFARYAREVIAHCGDLIDYVSTFNEANLSFVDFMPPGAATRTLAAAGRACGTDRFGTFLLDDVALSKPIVRQAHAAARATIRRARPGLPLGLTLAINDVEDAPGAPGEGVRMRAALYDVWLQAAREDDYVGVQNYTRQMFGPQGLVPPPADTPLTQLHQEIYAPSLANAVRYAAAVAQVPVLVSEHGIGTPDDAQRIRFIDASLAELHRAVAEGVELRGYIHWSLLDNFEWAFGYGPKFGLVAVDRSTQQRTPKPSAHFLGNLARQAMRTSLS